MFGIHPLVLVAVSCAMLLGLVLFVFGIRARRWIARVLCILFGLVLSLPAASLFVALYPELIDPRFRAYNAFYGDIQEGMTREEVFALVDRRYPAAGPRQRPKNYVDSAEQLGFFMNAETTFEPNCEAISLTMRDGRVLSKQYVPD